MANYAEEFSKLYKGNCSVKNKDWTAERFFDSTADCYAAEAALVSSLTSEAYNTYGFPVQYFVKNHDTKIDPLFGEDPLENIIRRFEVNMYAESLPNLQKQYELQGMIYTEIITMQCTIAHFDEASRIDFEDGIPKYESYIPRIGDIIYMEYSQLYYEIINVKKFAEGSTFLGAPITYQFSLRVWRNNHEFVDEYNENNDKMDDLRNFIELGETFNLETKTDTIEKTSVVTAETDKLSINDSIEKDIDKNKEPMDNVASHVIYKPEIPVEEQTDIDPFAGW